jgi:adenylate kinase family enzyme
LKNKKLILIRGLSGAGKTELANLICGDVSTRTEICVDEFFTNDQGEYHFEVEKLKEAHEWCKAETRNLLEDDWHVVVVHNTFSRKWEVDPYIEMGTKFGYMIHVINLYDAGLNDKELSERCVHQVSPSTISRQRKRWERDIFRESTPRHHQYPPYGYPPPPPHYGHQYGQPPHYGHQYGQPPQYGSYHQPRKYDNKP